MAWQNPIDHNQYRSEQSLQGTQADACRQLEDEVEDLQEQIGVLEEGLPGAPGAQRTALAKEIASYRRELESRETALRQCRSAREQASGHL